ncbi:protein translocase subunit SecF, partial [bacterium]|nr:protein translocase subunit SecF [bacterium]
NLKIYRNDNLETILNRSVNQCMNRTVNTALTVFLVVISLYLLGGEVIKGFAFAMLIGVFEGVYSTVFVASPIVYEWQVRHGGKEQLKMAKRKIR